MEFSFLLFREMDEVQNRLSTFFGGVPAFPIRFPTNGKSVKLPDWSPLVDIIEDDHEYVFKADLPDALILAQRQSVAAGVTFIAAAALGQALTTLASAGN
jgi:hypothetical protein